MNYTKCCISKSKNFNLVKINNNLLHPLNIIPLSDKYYNYYLQKQLYIYPNPINTYYSKKYGIYLGTFRIIYNQDIIYRKINTVNLPLNSRFFLLYYYIYNFQQKSSSIMTINKIFSSIIYMDYNNTYDHDHDIIMYPSNIV